MTRQPEHTVSLLIPAFNEGAFIGQCLDSVLANDYPSELFDVWVIDGQSSDDTVAVVGSYQGTNPKIHLIQNPSKVFPAAVNLGVKNSSGEIIIILGAHAKYAPDYISLCVKHLEELGADNVGGVMETHGLNTSFTGKLITLTLSNPFGVGNSVFRTGAKVVTEVDTVFGGCYRRSVFERIGLFNENLTSTSDMDFNTRLRKNGGKIFLCPDIHLTYYTRNSFWKFMRNNFRNGYWVIYPLRYCKTLPVSLRHLVPLAFFLGINLMAFLSDFISWMVPLSGGVLLLYFILAYYFAFSRMPRRGFHFALVQPVFFLLLHWMYGVGSFIALLRLIPVIFKGRGD